jgi:hypothetical protein
MTNEGNNRYNVIACLRVLFLQVTMRPKGFDRHEN